MDKSKKDFTVIIPSATLVPEELQNVGKLPPVIYPINQNIVFDFIYKQYQEIAETFSIVCYKNAAKVHRRLAKYAGGGVESTK